MGGNLSAAPKGKSAPTFLVAALKDPIGGNLDRIQVIKGWVDAKGKMHEKVYDVVWSGDRKPDACQCHLDQYHRYHRAHHRVEGPRF